MIQNTYKTQDANDQIHQDENEEEVFDHRGDVRNIEFIREHKHSIDDHHDHVGRCQKGVEGIEGKPSVTFFQQIAGNKKIDGKIAHRHGEGYQQAGEPDHIGEMVGIVAEEVEIEEPYANPEEHMQKIDPIFSKRLFFHQWRFMDSDTSNITKTPFFCGINEMNDRFSTFYSKNRPHFAVCRPNIVFLAVGMGAGLKK